MGVKSFIFHFFIGVSFHLQKLKSVVCEGVGTMTAVPPPLAVLDAVLPTDDAMWEGATDKKKLKRPGLSQTLVPGKKVIKMYKEQKIKDTNKN